SPRWVEVSKREHDRSLTMAVPASPLLPGGNPSSNGPPVLGPSPRELAKTDHNAEPHDGLPLPGLSFESVEGEVQAPFVTNGGYLSQNVVTGVDDGGRAIFKFLVTNAGNYTISADVSAPIPEGS